MKTGEENARYYDEQIAAARRRHTARRKKLRKITEASRKANR